MKRGPGGILGSDEDGKRGVWGKMMMENDVNQLKDVNKGWLVDLRIPVPITVLQPWGSVFGEEMLKRSGFFRTSLP